MAHWWGLYVCQPCLGAGSGATGDLVSNLEGAATRAAPSALSEFKRRRPDSSRKRGENSFRSRDRANTWAQEAPNNRTDNPWPAQPKKTPWKPKGNGKGKDDDKGKGKGKGKDDGKKGGPKRGGGKSSA